MAYQDTLEELWLQSNSITEKERLYFLFDSYIKRMLKRKKLNFIYSDNQTKIWLIWLAKIMNKTSKEVFLIENLQLDSFEHLIDRFAYCLGLLIIYFIIGFSVGKILLLQNSELIKGLLFGIPIFWLISQGYTVKTIEKIKWSWKKFFQTLKTSLLFSFFYISIGIAVMILFSFFGGDRSPSDYVDEYYYVNDTTVFAVVVFGFYILSIIFGIINSLIRGTTGMTIEKKSFPNQGILRSFKYSILFSFISLITTVIVAYLIHFPVVFWGVFGMFFGFTAGGGASCIKHFLLRIFLYLRGYIPWDYARFLNYATERIFLHKVGGSYIFIHRMLLEHFAQMELEQRQH